MCVDLLTVLSACNRALGLLCRGRGACWVLRNAEEVEGLRIDKHSWPPIAHLSIITDTHNRVLVMVANDWKAIDWVLMPILSQTALLNRLGSIFALAGYTSGHRLFFGSDIPLQQVAWHRWTDDNVRVMRIEHRLRNLILTVQCQLRPALKTDTKDVNEAVWLIHVPLATLAIWGKKNFRLSWWPIDRSHSTV